MNTDHRLSLRRAAVEQEVTRPLARVAVRLGRRQARLARRRGRSEHADQTQVFVHLMKSRLRERRRIGEEPAPTVAGEADPAPGAPVHRGRGRLERAREQHHRVPGEAPDDVRRAEPSAPRSGICHEHVAEPLAREEGDPRAGEQHLRVGKRLAQRADRRHRHHRVAEPVRQAYGDLHGHARRKACRHAVSPVWTTSRTLRT